MATQKKLFGDDSFYFDERFITDHAGQIVTDPNVAIVEVIANAYDAGARHVEVKWPDQIGGIFSVADDGTGLTVQEFKKRWKSFNYNRVQAQGNEVEFPPGTPKSIKRIAFGQSGKGRYAPFCFNNRYTVESRKDGKSFSVTLERTQGNKPFELTNYKAGKKLGHGTSVSVNIQQANKLLPVEDVRQLIGTKFLVDPSIKITLNDEPVALLDLQGVESETINVDPYGDVKLHFIDGDSSSRIAKLNGIAWWVNGKMVGEPTWNRWGNDGVYLDKRSGPGRRLSIIVEADFLKPWVADTWQKLHACKEVNAVEQVVHDRIKKRLYDALADDRKESKVAVIKANKETLERLPGLSQSVVTKFIDQVQVTCPTISEEHLEKTVSILAKLEESRDGYDLLDRLEQCSADDLDAWNRIMREWTATNAEAVLSELHRRLRLIQSMTALCADSATDELHELHPLFERGLWIFGPEYEAVDFRSNRGLTEVIRRFLGPTDYQPPIARPDLVVLPDMSIGTYAAPAYKDGEPNGVRKVLIIELKKGKFKLHQKEVDTARDYAKEINKSGKVQPSTAIEVVVLGDELEEHLAPLSTANITVTPMVYDTVLRKAHARTFYLHDRLKQVEPLPPIDQELMEALKEEELPPMFKTGT